MIDLGPLLQRVGHDDVISLKPGNEWAEGESIVRGGREGRGF
jgi:hypothetical protein